VTCFQLQNNISLDPPGTGNSRSSLLIEQPYVRSYRLNLPAKGVLAGQAARLAPLTGADAEDLIRAIRAAPALLEHAPGTGALRDTLLRVSRLADDLPQVVELDLGDLRPPSRLKG
jgi:ATP-grasp domain